MRRALSILLILLFAAGPTLFALDTNDDSSVPACCRRHGAHHCALLGSLESTAGDAGAAAVKAPSRCPQFPQHASARTSTFAAASSSSQALRVTAAEAPVAARSAANLASIHLLTPVLRGPPASHLA